MKKTLPIGLLSAICLIQPLRSTAQTSKISIRMSYGFSQGGIMTESAVAPRGYEPYVNLGPKRRSNTGHDVLVELFYRAHPRLILSLGIGHTSQTFPGNPAASDLRRTEIPEFLPEIGFESNPVLASVRLRLPLSPRLRFTALAGAGLYFTRFQGSADWTVRPEFQRSLSFSGSTRDTGYHAGLGLEIDASRASIVSLEAVYRSVAFGPMDSIALQPDGSAFNGYDPGDAGPGWAPLPEYAIQEVSFSGWIILAGFKFRFQ